MYSLPLILGRDSGKDLATRTRQRNHLIMRLRGAISFAKYLGLPQHHYSNYEEIINQLKTDQITDKKLALCFRSQGRKDK